MKAHYFIKWNDCPSSAYTAVTGSVCGRKPLCEGLQTADVCYKVLSVTGLWIIQRLKWAKIFKVFQSHLGQEGRAPQERHQHHSAPPPPLTGQNGRRARAPPAAPPAARHRGARRAHPSGRSAAPRNSRLFGPGRRNRPADWLPAASLPARPLADWRGPGGGPRRPAGRKAQWRPWPSACGVLCARASRYWASRWGEGVAPRRSPDTGHSGRGRAHRQTGRRARLGLAALGSQALGGPTSRAALRYSPLPFPGRAARLGSARLGPARPRTTRSLAAPGPQCPCGGRGSAPLCERGADPAASALGGSARSALGTSGGDEESLFTQQALLAAVLALQRGQQIGAAAPGPSSVLRLCFQGGCCRRLHHGICFWWSTVLKTSP